MRSELRPDRDSGRHITARVAVVAVVLLTACHDVSAPVETTTGPIVNGVRTSGTTSMLAIPALFASSTASRITPAQLQQRLFDGPSTIGTLTGFYRETSNNRFTLRGRVMPWVRTTVDASDSGDGIEGVSREEDYVIEALRAVDPTIDFGAYDNDGPDGRPNSGDDDGIVDGGVMIVTAESGRNCGPSGAVWPHVSPLSSRKTSDSRFRVADKTPAGVNIVVPAYIIVPAVTCSNELTGIAIAGHELMHLLFNTTEMYSFGSNRELQPNGARLWRTGCWDVMAAGSGWGCGTGPFAEVLTPVHMNPWIKETLGWVRSDTIGRVADTTIALVAAAFGGRTARVLIKPGEYFELEYRQQSGYDAKLPASGVLIYHVTLNRPVTPPTCVAWCTQPPLIVEADDNNGLLRTMDEGGNRGEAGDAFGAPGHTTFTATTKPAALGDDGTPTSLRILGIQIDLAAHVARIHLSN